MLVDDALVRMVDEIAEEREVASKDGLQAAGLSTKSVC